MIRDLNLLNNHIEPSPSRHETWRCYLDDYLCTSECEYYHEVKSFTFISKTRELTWKRGKKMIKTGIRHSLPPAIFMILAGKYYYKVLSAVSLWILNSRNKISICVIMCDVFNKVYPERVQLNRLVQR